MRTRTRFPLALLLLSVAAPLAGCGAMDPVDPAPLARLGSSLGSCSWNNAGQIVWDVNQQEFYVCVCNSQTESCAWNVWEPWNEGEDEWEPDVSLGWAMEIPYGSLNAGVDVHTWHYDGLARQFWQRAWNDASQTSLVNVGSRLCMGVQGGSTAVGAAIVQWPCNGNLDQLWTIQCFSNPNGCIFINNNSHHVLDANWGKGANLHQWSLNWNDNQIWRLDQY